MSRINLVITNASKYFTDSELTTISKATAEAESFIAGRFNFDYDVDLIVAPPTYLMSTIPEDGISGRTYDSRLIILVVDKKQKEITEDSVFETICHEMSHSLRWEKLSEYSETLFEGMILEGLAIALEEKAVAERGGEAQFFLKEVQETTDDEYDQMLRLLGDSLDDKEYDYETIFFTGNDKLARWAGYKLGYYFVKKYLKETGRTAEEATLDSYGLFLKS